MTWSTLPTYTNGVLTAAMLNAIRDNINESAAAKATTAGYHFVATGTNSIAQRAVVAEEVLTQQTTTSTTYTNLATHGPEAANITSGAKALIMIQSQLFNSGSGSTWASYTISGATTAASFDRWAISCEANTLDGFRFGQSTLHTVTAGVNHYKMQYRVSSGTGTFDDRHIIVMAF